jgi:hypothetical protein
MGRGKYDPASFSNAMGVFKEHLRQNSPEILQILQTPTIGFQYTPEAFVYFFMDQDRESFERLSKPPFVDHLVKATAVIEYDSRLTIRDLGTQLEHETFFEHTNSGIRMKRLTRDQSEPPLILRTRKLKVKREKP